MVSCRGICHGIDDQLSGSKPGVNTCRINMAFMVNPVFERDMSAKKPAFHASLPGLRHSCNRVHGTVERVLDCSGMVGSFWLIGITDREPDCQGHAGERE
jgi:hypothetical protein